MYILLLAFSRHYMAGILPIRRKTQHNQSIIASFLSRPSRLDFNIIIINCKQSRLFWYFFAITFRYYVDLFDICVDLSVIYVDFSDHYVDFSENNHHN